MSKSLMLLLTMWLGIACSGRTPDLLLETFDETGTWGVGSSADVEGSIADGAYQMLVKNERGLYLATAGLAFADATFRVEATQESGPLNSGYGLLFRVDEDSDSFYVFEISADGYVWIGRCRALCREEEVPLVGRGWFPSEAVRMGLGALNRLEVIADGPRMDFFVNGEQVGRTVDETLMRGDIAVAVETLGQAGVEVTFDNFEVTPQQP